MMLVIFSSVLLFKHEFFLTDISESAAVQEALNSGDRTDQRSGKLQTLLPYTAYRFRVRAINGFGRGNEASQPSGKMPILFTYSKVLSCFFTVVHTHYILR